MFYHNAGTVINREEESRSNSCFKGTSQDSIIIQYAKLQSHPLRICHEFFLSCASLMGILFVVFPRERQSHFLVSDQLESLSPPPRRGLVSFSAVQLAVEAEGLARPSLEGVDAVESGVVMLLQEDPLVVGCCQRKVVHQLLKQH